MYKLLCIFYVIYMNNKQPEKSAILKVVLSGNDIIITHEKTAFYSIISHSNFNMTLNNVTIDKLGRYDRMNTDTLKTLSDS